MTDRHGALPLASRYTPPVAAGVSFAKGDNVVLNASGYATKPSVATGLLTLGRAKHAADNSVGLDGAIYLNVEPGVYNVVNNGCAQTDVGFPVWWSSATAMAPDSGGGTRSIGGILSQIDDSGALRVEMSPTASEAAHAFASALAALPAAKKTVNITHATVAGVMAHSGAVNIGTALPTNARIIGTSIRLTTPFSGGGAGSCTVDVGGTDADALVDGRDIFTGAPAAGVVTQGVDPHGFLSGQQLVATLAADVDLDALTAGDMTIDVLYTVLA